MQNELNYTAELSIIKETAIVATFVPQILSMDADKTLWMRMLHHPRRAVLSSGT